MFRTQNSQGGTDLAVINADGTGYAILLGGTGHRHEAPRWSPDGSVLAFHSNRHLDDPEADAAFRQYEVYTIRVSDGVTRRLTQRSSADRAHLEPNWSPDGTRLVAESRVVQDRYTRIEHRMFTMDAAGLNPREIPNDTRSRFPRWSP